MVLNRVELCAEIASHLSVKDACVLKRTSKFFYNLFTENAVFVEHITPLFSDGKLFALAGKDAAFSVVARKGWLYERASPELQADKDFLLAAIKGGHGAIRGSHSHCPSILFFAPKKLQADRGVVLAAVTSNSLEYLFACEELQKDPDVLEAHRQSLDKLDPKLRSIWFPFP